MNHPWIYMYSPSHSPLPPPSPSHPSGSCQSTSPEHLSHASNLGCWSVSPLIVYLFQCVSWFRAASLHSASTITQLLLFQCVYVIVRGTTDQNGPPWPDKMIVTCMNYLATGGPNKECRTNKLPSTRRIQEKSEGERRDWHLPIQMSYQPPRILLAGIHLD